MTSARHAKAPILRRLRACCVAFRVEPFVDFSISDWRRSAQDVLHAIDEANLGPTLVVRSAWRTEDWHDKTHPGQFLSVQGISAQDWLAVASTIERVIESYRCAGELSEQDDRVIVQRQMCDIRLAGVAVPSASRLYLDVDFDDFTGRTDTVTAGLACRTVSIWTMAPLDGHWGKLVAAHREVEQLMGEGQWALEFGIDLLDGAISVFQARRVRQTLPRRFRITPVIAAVSTAREAIPNRTMLSDMADWNPAEMLGSQPRPLANSLYQQLVTDWAWERARSSLGYRALRQTKLAVEVVGKLYVDVAKSCLSLLPRGLPPGLARRLCADRIARLREEAYLHDRVETGLFFSCGDVLEVPRTRELLARGFSREAVDVLELGLNKLTHVAVRNEPTLGKIDAEAVKGLWDWYKRKRPQTVDVRARLRFALSAMLRCRDLGVVPFARQARLAFIGQDLLGRLVESGAISSEWVQDWWRDLDSVASRISRAIENLGTGVLLRPAFDEEFGHLRMRAYDIRCMPYNKQQFHSSAVRSGRTEETMGRALQGLDRRGARLGLARSGVDVDPEDFLLFVRRTAQAREDLKLGFTKVLSAIMEEIAELGASLSFSREDLSYLRVEDLSLCSRTTNSRDLAQKLDRAVERRKIEWEAVAYVKLPDLIRRPEDLFVVEDVRARPSYITNRTVTAECVVYDSRVPPQAECLHGRILVAEAAEPGMDWIFAYRIAGIVTQYGGRNSHMATRCAEFGLPAAIGCGAAVLKQFRTGMIVRLDCAREQIELLGHESDAGDAGDAGGSGSEL